MTAARNPLLMLSSAVEHLNAAIDRAHFYYFVAYSFWTSSVHGKDIVGANNQMKTSKGNKQVCTLIL